MARSTCTRVVTVMAIATEAHRRNDDRHAHYRQRRRPMGTAAL